MNAPFVGLSLIVLLAGCASSALRPTESSLKTRITEEGLKFFELTFPEMPGQMLRPSAQGTQSPPQTLTIEKMERITYKIALESGFCRSEPKLLGRFAGQTVNSIRGECTDKASPEDRQKFADTIERW